MCVAPLLHQMNRSSPVEAVEITHSFSILVVRGVYILGVVVCLVGVVRVRV